jgi:hypothetical protein
MIGELCMMKTNMYSIEMNEKSITLVSLTPKKIYEEQLKLMEKKIVEKESLYIRGPFFLINRGEQKNRLNRENRKKITEKIES